MSEITAAIKRVAQQKEQINQLALQLLLMSHASELRIKDPRGRAALHRSAYHGQVSVVKTLIVVTQIEG